MLNNLVCQTIPETHKSFTLPLQELVTPLDRLHHFSSIDVGIAALVYVVDDFGR